MSKTETVTDPTAPVQPSRPYIAHASAVVAPLRIARGVQNKVLEGMAMGRTVIASPDAAEGIDAIEGRELAVASTPDEYVAAIRSVFAGACDLGREARERRAGVKRTVKSCGSGAAVLALSVR